MAQKTPMITAKPHGTEDARGQNTSDWLKLDPCCLRQKSSQWM